MKKLIKILLVIILIAMPFSAFASLNTKSIDFDRGSSQYLSITNANQTGLGITGDMTIEAWIYIDQLPTTAGGAFDIVSKWAAAGDNRSYELVISGSSDKLILNFSDNGTAARYTNVQSSAAIITGGDVGNWVHVAVALDVSTASSTIWKNGSIVSSTNNGGSSRAIADKTSDVFIGRGDGAGNFDGHVDEARIWNDMRTDGEISDNYDIQIDGSSVGLAGYWRFNDSLLDETSNNNDLTNNNTATYNASVPFAGEGDTSDDALFFGVNF